jgi:hypothetical protein
MSAPEEERERKRAEAQKKDNERKQEENEKREKEKRKANSDDEYGADPDDSEDEGKEDKKPRKRKQVLWFKRPPRPPEGEVYPKWGADRELKEDRDAKFVQIWDRLLLHSIDLPEVEATRLMTDHVNHHRKNEEKLDPVLMEQNEFRRARRARLTPWHRLIEVMGYRWRRRKHKLRMRDRIFKICQGDVVQAKMEHETRVVRVVQEEKRFNECAVNAGAVRSHTPVQSD